MGNVKLWNAFNKQEFLKIKTDLGTVNATLSKLSTL